MCVCESESRLVMSNSLQPHELYSPWDSPIQSTRVASCFLLQGIFPTQGLNPGLLQCGRPGFNPNTGIEPRSPTLRADSLPAEPPGKPKNTGVDSLSLLQRIFLTQESNWSLLHCRWILYQLSYQGSPIKSMHVFNSNQEEKLEEITGKN